MACIVVQYIVSYHASCFDRVFFIYLCTYVYLQKDQEAPCEPYPVCDVTASTCPFLLLNVNVKYKIIA